MTKKRPFRFGLQATKARSAGEWRQLARRTEDLGYSTLFVADHYVGRGRAAREAHLPPQHLAPIASMATAAAVTTTLRVGCRVFCVDYHLPAVLAKEAATLDLLSDGRLEFGIGAGWSESEYGAIGVPFEAPGRRVSKLEEVVALLKAHWSGEELDEHGEFVHVTGYSGLPAPVSSPHPPIMIGGGKRRVLSLAAREADIVSINNVPFDSADPAAEAVRRLGFVREAAGERFGSLDIEASPWFSAVTADPAAALAKVADLMRVPADGLLAHPNVLAGSVSEVVDTLEERRETFGINYVSVQQGQLDEFAPIVAKLAGA